MSLRASDPVQHPAPPTPGAAAPEVTVLLGQMNGAPFLAAQLASIAAQSGCRIRLIVSDDGSTDEGPEMVAKFAARHGHIPVRLISGPGQGFARNFLHLLRTAGPETPHVALCDQDDVWFPGRLARALRLLETVPPDMPALYGARTLVTGPDLTPRAPSPLHGRAPCFRNALVQSIAGGNTMVLNRAALDLAQAASLEAKKVVSHDWWLFQIVSGAGGRVIYDPEPAILYRQHGRNMVGANNSIRGGLIRLGAVMAGRFAHWNAANIETLSASSHRFTPENRAALEGFAALRRAPLPRRLWLLARLGLYRQTFKGNLGLWLATALGRI